MRLPAKILYVDDDPLVLRAVARALRTAEELTVDTASTPAEARERMLSGEYAVLLSDYDMPGEDGISLIESVEPRCDAVAVLLTGHATLELALDAINRGHVYAYVQKPCESKELLATVRRAVERFELGRALHNKIAELERINEALTKRHEELVAAHAEVEKLREVASVDYKTGAHSYRYFIERLEEEVARAARYEQPLSLLLLDLDGFKAANDRLGHLGGDAVLRDVAEILRNRVRLMDLVARFGGDEFAVLLPSTADAGAAILGERLRAAICNARLGEATPGEVTTSIGIASLPHADVRTARDLVERADRALYRAKDGGRNRCESSDRFTDAPGRASS